MPLVTLGYAALLLILGIGAFVMTSAPTALIPAGFGVVFVILGVLSMKEKMLKHAMHAASMLALIAMIGTGKGAFNAIRLIGGAEVARPPAAIAQGIMFTLSLIFLALCVNSFIQTRRKRVAQSGG